MKNSHSENKGERGVNIVMDHENEEQQSDSQSVRQSYFLFIAHKTVIHYCGFTNFCHDAETNFHKFPVLLYTI
jgi:hypothetical protein